MKRPPRRPGVAKSTSAKQRPVVSKSLPQKPPVEKLTNVVSLKAARAKRDQRSRTTAVVSTKAPKRAKTSGPGWLGRAQNVAKARVFERLSPEAARFRAYSRRRRAILLSTVGSFMALVLLMLAAMFTPMLAVENIKITGLSRLKEAQIQRALKDQIGTPLPMVSAESVGKALSAYTLIESFSITSRPPHTLQVSITERSPIGIVNLGGVPYLFDPAGVRIGKASGKDQYPKLAINGNPSTSREFALAIDVLLALPASLLPRVESIDAKSKDNVVMVLRGAAGQQIVWGDASDSVLKSKVLAALIKNHTKNDRVTFDVSSPQAPVVRY